MQPLNILRFLQSTENYCIVKSMRIYLVSLTVCVYKNNKLGFDACNAAKKIYRLKILQRQITETFKKKRICYVWLMGVKLVGIYCTRH